MFRAPLRLDGRGCREILPDSLTLDDCVKAIHGWQYNGFPWAVSPEDLQLFDVIRDAEAKVDAQVALRNIAPARGDFSSLPEASGGAEHHAADRVARRFACRVSFQLH